jgi:hypothetical protein
MLVSLLLHSVTLPEYHRQLKMIKSRVWWLTSVISDTQKAEIRRMVEIGRIEV